MVVPMDPTGSVFRSISPVAGCVIVVAAGDGVNPMVIYRLACLPLCLGFLMIFIVDLVFNMGVFGSGEK